MILKAQLEGERVDPYLQGKDLQGAEEKRKHLKEAVDGLHREWVGRVEKVIEETELNLSQNEICEFKARIAILGKELQEKNGHI